MVSEFYEISVIFLVICAKAGRSFGEVLFSWYFCTAISKIFNFNEKIFYLFIVGH